MFVKDIIGKPVATSVVFGIILYKFIENLYSAAVLAIIYFVFAAIFVIDKSEQKHLLKLFYFKKKYS